MRDLHAETQHDTIEGMKTSESFGLTYETQVPGDVGYRRNCPICARTWTSSKMALRCWFEHPSSDGGGTFLAQTPVTKISAILGVSEDTVRKSWHYLVAEVGAPPRKAGTNVSPGDNYTQVVHFLQKQRQLRHGLQRGWSEDLATKLGISRQRVSQLRSLALKHGDV